MNNIKHQPSFDVKRIETLYSKKDGVDVSYVCTTEINGNNLPCDVFFRETPHPEFGNRYFAILNRGGSAYITNADSVEGQVFAMVKNSDGSLKYSRFRHDFVSSDTGNFVDGGRAYIRSSGKVYFFKMINGDFVEVKETEEAFT